MFVSNIPWNQTIFLMYKNVNNVQFNVAQVFFEKKKLALISNSLRWWVDDEQVSSVNDQHWATPFIIHTPPVEDFGKPCHRGSVNFQMHLLSVVLDKVYHRGSKYFIEVQNEHIYYILWIRTPAMFWMFLKPSTRGVWNSNGVAILNWYCFYHSSSRYNSDLGLYVNLLHTCLVNDSIQMDFARGRDQPCQWHISGVASAGVGQSAPLTAEKSA